MMGLLLLFSILLVGDHYSLQLEASRHVDQKRFQTTKTGSLLPNQPYRTGYHFQPSKNWMNDPNGPMLHKGIYHLFYQWNPKGAVWCNIVWGHSTSTDLVNWTPHEPAIYPSQPFDINGCWSGSATILPYGKPVILYTGINTKNQQVQNLAMPKDLSDPYLREWVKLPENPLMSPDSVNRIDPSLFRDPTTAWFGPDQKWHVIIGSKTGSRGMAILYTSHDFKNWTESAEPLHYKDGSGMWECPDFFPVARFGSHGVDTSSYDATLKYVLKVSLDDTKHDHYTIGTYDRVRDVYIPDAGFFQNESAPRYDYGKYYASKTFFDGAKRRRLLWGWVNESSPVTDDIAKGWSGLQAIPRKIWLEETGKKLRQWPIEEIETLRTNPVNWPTRPLIPGSLLQVYGITPAQADVEVSFEVNELENAEMMEPGWTDPQLVCSQKNVSVKGGLGPFGLLVLASKNLEEYTAIYFRIFKSQNNNASNNKYVVLMCSDQSRSSLKLENDRTTYGAFVDVDPIHQPLSLRTLIDHSIVESYGGEGKACITSRVYPTMAIGEEDAHLYAFNNGSQSVDILRLSAWSMKSAHIN